MPDLSARAASDSHFDIGLVDALGIVRCFRLVHWMQYNRRKVFGGSGGGEHGYYTYT